MTDWCSWCPASGRWRTSRPMTRSGRSMSRRLLPTAPTTSSSAGRSARPRTRALGNFFPTAKNPGRYCTHVSHHSAQRQLTTTMPDSMHAIIGMIGLLAIAWALGEDRRGVPWRAIAAGVALELVLAIVFLKIPAVKGAFMTLNDALLILEKAT